MKIFSMAETLTEAVHTYHLDREGVPELVPLGFPDIDEELGGLGPGSCGILAAATGVGKSSAMLAAMLNSPVKVGAVSLEDGPDVIGARILAALTGINSRRIRRKVDLTGAELTQLLEAAKHPQLDNVFFAYPTAGRLAQVEAAATTLAGEFGCKLVWLDYLQKVRGHGKNDRRNEVGETFTSFQRACAEGGAAGMAISQFRRLTDGERVPQIFHLKESGDLENEARLIVLAHKQQADSDPTPRVRFFVAKSVFGGESLKFDYTRDDSGTLRRASLFDPLDDEDF